MNHRSPFCLTFALVFLAFCSLPFAAHAQSASATLSGTVEDQNGAVVPGATVTAENKATGLKRQVTTNGEGYFTIPLLPPSTYSVTAQAGGFSPVQVSNVVLNVGDQKALQIQLKAGDINATVQVVNEAPLIEESPAVSTVVDRNFAENLPMNGRSFQTLIQLTPGVVLTPSNGSDGGQFSVNGQRAASNYWMVDGVSANIGTSAGTFSGNGFGGALGSFSAQGGTNSLVSVDAMQEFRIQTSTYAPEFGRTPGAQISIVTRPGTNQFHGTLFEYFRNDVLDANDWFANSAGLLRPKERQNDFGGTFSGPLIKEKTFFFFSDEELRLQLPQVALTTVPDLLARQNAVAAMQPYLNAYPVPNGADNLTTGIAQFNASYSNKSTLDAFSVRIDHTLTKKINLFGRYNYSPSEIDQRGNGRTLNTVSPSRITTHTATFGSTWIISSAVTNDLRFNYSKVNASSKFLQDTFGGAVPLPSLPFPSTFTSENASFVLNILPLTRSSMIAGGNAKNSQQQINFVDNVVVQKGSHSLKFGLDFRRLAPERAQPLYAQLALFLSVASAKAGQARIGGLNSRTAVTLLFRNLGVFAQDTWHVNPRLTLTYGLRWDVDFSPSSLNGPSIPAVTGYNSNDFSQLAVAPTGTPPFRTKYNNVAPRFGLAYQVTQNKDWQSVLRGGFGVFYDLVSSETGSLIGFGAPPFAAAKSFLNSTFPFTPAQIAPPPIPPASISTQFYGFNPNLKLPYTLEWNVALEQSLGKQQTISASYLGAAGKRLLQTSLIFGFGNFVDNTAYSRYNSLQIQFQRRLSRGVQALASYTWARSIDTGSAGSTQLQSNVGAPGNPNLNRGPSAFDIRNAFSAALTYDIPAPKTSALLNAILRGWSLQNIIQARSAPPVDVSDANFFQFNGGIFADVRPDVVAGQPFYLFGSQYPGGKALNPAAFTDPPSDPNTGNPLRQGTLPRNALRGFGAVQWDFALHRDFRLRESIKLQFRTEMFNVLNHPNFGPPNGSFGGGGFGVSSQMLGRSLAGSSGTGAGAFDPLYQIGGPRSIQFALKLVF